MMRKDKIEPTLTFSCLTISVYLLEIRVGTVEDKVLKKPSDNDSLVVHFTESKSYTWKNINVFSVCLSKVLGILHQPYSH